jgi:hypothetical protein
VALSAGCNRLFSLRGLALIGALAVAPVRQAVAPAAAKWARTAFQARHRALRVGLFVMTTSNRRYR